MKKNYYEEAFPASQPLHEVQTREVPATDEYPAHTVAACVNHDAESMTQQQDRDAAFEKYLACCHDPGSHVYSGPMSVCDVCRGRYSEESFNAGYEAGRASLAADLPSLQDGVWRWCKDTFDGIVSYDTDQERSYRFFEEAGELFQAMGMYEDDALKVVSYVYNRPVGEKSQEIGGVMITLLALAEQQGLSVQDAMMTEFERIHRPEIQTKIRLKQMAKKQAFL